MNLYVYQKLSVFVKNKIPYNDKANKTWNAILDHKNNGTYTVSSIANYKEIYMYFRYSIQIQETMYMTCDTFRESDSILIRDASNSQYAKIKFNSNTSITISEIANTDWKFSIFGR